MSKIKYSWNETDEDFWCHGEFDTVEDCIKDAKYNYYITDTIFVGEVEPYEIYVDADTILECIEEEAYNDCGEAAENWTPSRDVDQEEINKLSMALTTIVKTWLKDHRVMPNFYSINNIRGIDVNSGFSVGKTN